MISPSAEQMAQRYRSLLAGESLPADLRAWAEIGADVLPAGTFDRLREYLAVAADEIDRLRKDTADAATLLASLSQELERIKGENAKTATLALDNLRLQQSLETVKGERDRLQAEIAELRAIGGPYRVAADRIESALLRERPQEPPT